MALYLTRYVDQSLKPYYVQQMLVRNKLEKSHERRETILLCNISKLNFITIDILGPPKTPDTVNEENALLRDGRLTLNYQNLSSEQGTLFTSLK